MIDLNAIRKHVITALAKGLPPSLTYHNVSHTLDVETQCLTIAAGEGITDEQSLLQLRIAALYHDYGFLYTYVGHEERSCAAAKKELPDFGLNENEIVNICRLILATKVPQSPRNTFEKIICDADLDYLGRDDYFIINESLRTEFIAYGIIGNKEDWEKSKISFLKCHAYFTRYCRHARDPKKLSHLEYLLTLSGEQ